MKNPKLFLVLSIILTYSILSTGCADKSKITANNIPNKQVNQSKQGTFKLTLDEIKKKYTDVKIKSIQNIGDECVLVESQRATFANRFDLYNLKTGDMDTLPTMPNFVTLEEVENENSFIFLCSGKNSESSIGNFPFLVRCIRVKSDINKCDDFTALPDDKYFALDNSVQSGSKHGELMSNLNVTFDGLEVSFEPIKGNEAEFNAGATDIPPTKTSYNKERKQITFEIEANQLGQKLNSMKKGNLENNQYMSSYEINQKDNKIYLTITVRNLVKTYMVKSKRLPNGLPYLTIMFSQR